MISRYENMFYSGDFNYEGAEKILLKGPAAKIITQSNMYLSGPILSITNRAEIKADGNMYLFNLKHIECNDSKISVGGNLYLPVSKVSLNNCHIAAMSTTYIDDSNKGEICNSSAYESSESLKQYCALLGGSNTAHDEL